jgi:hypothetical protein
MAADRPCAICGQECSPWQRNTDGSYLHDKCAASVRPVQALRSRAQEKEGTDGA